MPPRSQSIDEALRTGISLPTRTIYMVGEVDEDMFKTVRLGLDLLDGEGRITNMVLCSGGGSCYNGLAIYDAIHSAVGEIHIVGTGCVHSMATVILQAGDERILTPSCRILLHSIIDSSSRKPLPYLKADLVEDEILKDTNWRIISQVTGLSIQTLKDRYSIDHYFSAAEAVALGLADRVA